MSRIKQSKQLRCESMRIKALREKQNLSQQDLAQETGVSCTTIDQWEKGEALPDKVITTCRL